MTNAANGTGNGAVSLWKAADLTAIGNFTTGVGTAPIGACSDGINFFVSVQASGVNRLIRF